MTSVPLPAHPLRALALLALLVLPGLLLLATPACSSPSPVSCTEAQDCFENEACRAGICVAVEPDTGEPDCVENIGICGEAYCHPERRTCVACVRNDHCPGPLVCDPDSSQCVCPSGTHLCGDTCVDSSAVAHCGTRCEPCPTEFGADATCSRGQCALECAAGFFPCTGPDCQTACVECAGHADCTDPARSRCVEGRCQGCATSRDCASQPDTPVCDTDTGTCIECTVDESGACGGNSCDPATQRCTDTPIRSLTDCERCKADIECQDYQRCIPMNFAGQSRPDGYCMDIESLRACDKPFPMDVERVSLSGHPLTRYCGIREEKITCEAFHDFGSRCDDDSDCGAPTLDDGTCTWFSGGASPRYRCTYPCTNSEDCPAGSFCTSPNNGFCLDSSGS